MPGNRSGELLATLPRRLGEMLAPHAGAIASAIIAEVQRTVPAYSQPLDGAVGRVLVDSVEQAVLQCMRCVGNPEMSNEQWVELFRARGKIEFDEGRNMDALQTAARVGGRVAWRYISPLIKRFGFPVDDVAIAAEAIFAYVDELSSTAVEGYHEAQTRGSGASELRRRQLLELILTAPESSTLTIASLAKVVDWTVPEQLSVVALRQVEPGRGFPAELLSGKVLVDLESEQPCLLTADPRRHLSSLEGCWHGWRAAVSPSVALADAPAALRTARRALELLDADDQRPVIWCQDHLATLWLLAEDFLAAELAKRSLDPFETLTEKQRDRLSETLLAWLETRGGAPEIAKRLDVHPQTVRARLHQLEQLFGDRLNDPDNRLDMQLALRSQRLVHKIDPVF
ncbi:helix-turn-helix domain-containing protein [Amycolatopsis nigrescens]|uniref:PucR family transcriptional regulator n=1 Tax=Amycolatopsis nigrescens TaxID=381445 RepID=UPI0003679408|nr:helix-turn-helix domain-containing protein [Amycolatopsis nigrescens]